MNFKGCFECRLYIFEFNVHKVARGENYFSNKYNHTYEYAINYLRAFLYPYKVFGL